MAPVKKAKSGRPTKSVGKVKQDLLAVTIRLLNTLGPKGATARAICQAAGVGAPVIYHHYGDLNGLYQAAIDESFRNVAACYVKSAKAQGPLRGIRDSWDLFMQFAYEEPRMCRLVIEHILAGEPPRAVARTLQNIARDIDSMGVKGQLKFSPVVVSQMLWVGALGSVGFIASERNGRKAPDRAIHESVREAILAALFARPAPASARPASKQAARE